MAGLKENTQYKNYKYSLAPVIKAATQVTPQHNVGRVVPQSNKPDISQYKGISNAMQSASKSMGQVTVPYGGGTKFEKFHPGIDIANKIGSPIQSFTPGKVTEIKGGQVKGAPGFGNYIIITDQQGNQHRYSHLSQSYVQLGQPVQRGTRIGGMGNTGQTYSLTGGTGSHLDYRIQDIYNKYINPSRFIRQ